MSQARFEEDLPYFQDRARVLTKDVQSHWREDAIQAVLLAGLEAAQRWDPEGGASLRTYVCRRMAGAVVDHARQVLGDKRLKSWRPTIRLGEADVWRDYRG